MQRHPALQDLSRDHFVALNHVVQIARVRDGHPQAKPLDDVWAGFVDWAGGPLMDHFLEEDELLLPLLERMDGQALATRLEADHARLRETFQALRSDAPEIQILADAAEDLRRHVRWEEEQLFEALQGLDDGMLQALGDANRRFRSTRHMPVGRV